MIFELRHFDANLHAWEEKNEVQQFKFVKAEANRVYFESFTFENVSENEIKGRIDKKFCSDYCRNAYNNKLNKDSNNLVRNINNRLRKNYRILEAYELKEGKTRTTKNSLLNKGFDFDYITSLYTTKKGSTYFFVYDLGYLPLDNDFYMLVKRV